MMTIRTELIETNKEYTYKELCIALNEEQKSRGNSRTSQFKNWERYFSFYKPNPKGHKFIVTEIYDTPKDKIDGRANVGQYENRRGNNTVYGDLLDVIIKSQIQGKTTSLYFTINKIALFSGMINENYKIAISNRALFSKYAKDKLNIHNESSIRNSFYNIRNIIRPAINSSIKRLTRKGYIESRYGYIIQIDIEVFKKQLLEKEDIILNEDAEALIDKIRLATENEEKEIKQIEKQVLYSFGASNTNELKGDNLKRYFMKVNKYIRKIHPEFEMIYKGYEIKALEKMKDINYNTKEIQESKNEINKIFISRLERRFSKDVNDMKSKINTCKNRVHYFGLTRAYTPKKYESEIAYEHYIETSMKVCMILIGTKEVKLTIQDMTSTP